MLSAKTETGTKSVHTTGANNNYSFIVTFKETYVVAPVVKVSATTRYDDGTYSAGLSASASNITTTGCIITVKIWCAYPTTTTITWTVTGYGS